MKLQKRALLPIALVSASLLTACGGSSSGVDANSVKPGSQPSLETASAGRVIDGYVSNAIVCADTNDNRVCDNGEARTQSGSQGAYSLPVQVKGLLLATGGRNNDTMSANNLILFSPVKSTGSPSLTRQITPLTTLAAVFAGQAAEPGDYTATAAILRQTFGLSPSFNLYQDDPIALANDATRSASERSAALAVHRLGVQVANTVITSIALDGRSDVPAQNQKFAAIASLLALNNGQAPDLKNEAQLRKVLLLSSEVDPTDTQVTRLAQANGAVAAAPTTALVGNAQNAYVTSLNTDPNMDNGSTDNSNGNGSTSDEGAGGDNTDSPNDMNGNGNGNGNGDNTTPPATPDAGTGLPDFLSPTVLCAIPVLGELLVNNVFSALPGFSDVGCEGSADGGAIGGAPSIRDIPVLGDILAGPISMIPGIGEALAGAPAEGSDSGDSGPSFPTSPEEFFEIFAGLFESFTSFFPKP